MCNLGQNTRPELVGNVLSVEVRRDLYVLYEYAIHNALRNCTKGAADATATNVK